jgi:hypothetical protein
MLDWSFGEEAGPDEGKLLDHQPLRLNNDDYERVKQIPVKKVGGLIVLLCLPLLFVLKQSSLFPMTGSQLP